MKNNFDFESLLKTLEEEQGLPKEDPYETLQKELKTQIDVLSMILEQTNKKDEDNEDSSNSQDAGL